MIGKKINQLATELAPVSTDLTIIGDPTTGVSKKITLAQLGAIFSGAVSFYTNLASFPALGDINVIYCAKDTKKLYLWDGSAYVEVFPAQALLDTYQLRSEKGVSNGYASLDSGGKVPISQLPSSIMEYKGTWNAATNTPTLANGTGDTGDVYICNVAGTVNFGAGPITFAVGDYVIYSGSIWQRSSGAVGTVTSVAVTRSGDALAITGSPITTSGTINVGFAGTSAQYINGAGNLVTFPSIISQAANLVTEVYNSTGATLTKGTIVYINGGQGNLPTVTKAIATGDATSAQTFGIVQNDITNNNNGYVVIAGKLTDLDTQAYTEGTQLYLSSTTAGAWTSTKQYAPAHLVYVGIVVRAHPTQGIVEVKIQNGYELDEIHNVAAQTPTNNDGLFWEASTNLWKNKSIATILGGTPVTGTGTSGQVAYFNGTSSITSNASFAFTPTSQLLVNNSVTAASAIARGTNLTPTLTAAANNDVLVGLDIAPTFSNGAFTGVTNWGARLYNSIRLETSSDLGQGIYWKPANDGTTLRIYGSSYSGGVGYLQLNVQSGNDGLSVNGSARTLTISAATSSISLSTTNIIFNTHGTGEAARIVNSSKNFLINTTTDAGFRLDVNGTARVQSFTTINATTAVNSDSALTVNATTNNSTGGQMYGIRSVATVATNTGNLTGIESAVNNSSTATNMSGFNSSVNVSANTTAQVRGYSVGGAVTGTGVVSNYIGYDYVDVFKSGSGAVTRNIALRIANLTAGGSANVGILFNNSAGTAVNGTWDIYSQSGNNSYLAGSLGIGATNLTGINLFVSKTLTGSIDSYHVNVNGIIQSDVTNSATYFRSSASTVAATFTLGTINHYVANQGSLGAGSTLTNQYGFVVNSNLIGATNNFGFFGNIASGTNRWNLYMNGTADNYMAGSLGIGATSLSIYVLRLQKNITGGALSFGIMQHGQVQSDVTTAYGINNESAISSTVAATDYVHYRAAQGTWTAGGTVTTQTGFLANSALTSATNNYGFRGAIPSGTNRWNLYMDGTANNYMAGSLNIGTTTVLANYPLNIQGTVNGSLLMRFANTSNGTSARLGLILSTDTGALGSIDAFGTAYTGGADDTANGVRVFASGAGGLSLRASNASSTIRFYNGSTESARFGTNGSLLLNTTTDAGFRLDVNGTARVQGNTTLNGILIQSSGTSESRLTTTAGSGLEIRSDGSTSSDRNINFKIGTTTSATITSAGNLEIVTGSIKTGSPSGGTAQPWKLGTVYTGTCVPTTFGEFGTWFTGTVIEIEVNGTTYKIPAVIDNYC